MKNPLRHRLQQGVIFLENKYPVQWNGHNVGEVCLERKGLFWHITCKCNLMETDARIVAVSDGHRTDLGIYPAAESVERWISVKSLQLSDTLFFTLEKHTEQFVPLTETAPFEALAQLSAAKFEIRDGRPGMLLPD